MEEENEIIFSAITILSEGMNAQFLSLRMHFRVSRFGYQESNVSTICMLGNFYAFCGLLILYFYSNSIYSTNTFRNTPRLSNNFDPDQARRRA